MGKRATFWLGIFLTLCLCLSLSWNQAFGGGIAVNADKTDLLVNEKVSGTISISNPDKPEDTDEVRYVGEVTHNAPSVSGEYTPFPTEENPDHESLSENGVSINDDGTKFTFTGNKPGTWVETFTVTFPAIQREKYNTETEEWEDDGEYSFEPATASITFTVKAIKLSISAKEYIPVKSKLNPDRYTITITATPKPIEGSITLTAAGDKLNLYTAATGGTATTSLTWNATSESYTAYMEGKSASERVGDQTLKAEYSGAGTEPASMNVTVVSVSISAPRWTAKGKRGNVALSYSPPDLDKGTIDLGGSATKLFDFYEKIKDEETGEEKEETATLSWALPRDNNSISIIAEAKEPGDGKLDVTHSESGAKAETDAGVIEVDIILDGLNEDEEEYPGAFIGFKKRKSLVLKAEPKSAGGTVSLSLSTGLNLYDAESNGNLITNREWDINSIPTNLYVEGAISSNSVRDKEGKLTYKNFSDVAKATVVWVGVGAFMPSTTYIAPMPIPEANFDANKIGIRLNGDYDNGATTRDWFVSAVIPSENDLILTEITIWPPPATGLKYLLKQDTDRVSFWQSSQKGGTPLVVPATGQVVTTSKMLWAEWRENVHGTSGFTLAAIEERTGETIIEKVFNYRSFTSVTCAFVGELQQAGADYGMNVVVRKELLNGYDVHIWDDGHDPVGIADCNEWGEGRAFDEIANAINNRKITRTAVIGYSHGGGSTYNLTWRMFYDGGPSDSYLYWYPPQKINNPFFVRFTSYVDAVTNNSSGNPFSENRSPRGSGYHLNQYQTNGSMTTGVLLAHPKGCATAIAHGGFQDVVYTEYPRYYHESIDKDAEVHRILMQNFEDRVPR